MTDTLRTLRAPRAAIQALTPYDASEPTARIVLASNENPQLPPQALVREVEERMEQFAFNRYPDPTAERLRAQLAQAQGLRPAQVLVGNGADELILDLMLAWGGPGRTMLNVPPTFSMYRIYAQTTETAVINVPRHAQDFSLDREAILEQLATGVIDLVFIASPNNPSGNTAPDELLREILSATDALVCIDEAYFEFSRTTARPWLDAYPNLAILRTFSKAFSLASLRLGYIMASEDIIETLLKVRMPYSVNAFSQMVAEVVLAHEQEFAPIIGELIEQRDLLECELAATDGVTVYPSQANYLLFRVERAHELWQTLLDEHSILLRDFSAGPGTRDCLRVTVGSPAENQAFLAALRTELSPAGAVPARNNVILPAGNAPVGANCVRPPAGNDSVGRDPLGAPLTQQEQDKEQQ